MVHVGCFTCWEVWKIRGKFSDVVTVNRFLTSPVIYSILNSISCKHYSKLYPKKARRKTNHMHLSIILYSCTLLSPHLPHLFTVNVTKGASLERPLITFYSSTIHVLTYAPVVLTSEGVVDEVFCWLSPSATVAAAAAAFLASWCLFLFSSIFTNLRVKTLTLQNRQGRQSEI